MIKGTDNYLSREDRRYRVAFAGMGREAALRQIRDRRANQLDERRSDTWRKYDRSAADLDELLYSVIYGWNHPLDSGPMVLVDRV